MPPNWSPRLNRALTPLARAWALTLSALSAAPAGADQAVQLSPVTVTAQKVAESEQQVPAAMTVIEAEELEQLGVEDFEQLSQFTPGFWANAESPNSPVLTLRGLNANSPDSFAEARVSVYQDGVSISKLQASGIELFDLERVEVLKGPQPTLFGKDSLVGGVNIIQRKAQPVSSEGYLRGELGSDQLRALQGAWNLPLGSRYALRLAGLSHHQDGYVDNALGDDLAGHDVDALRLSAAARPTDALSIDAIVNVQHDTTTGTAYKSGSFLPTDPVTGAVVGDLEPWHTAALRSPEDFVDGRDLGLDRRIGDASLLLSLDLSPRWSLHSTTAYRKFDSEEIYDIDGTSLNFLTAFNDAEGAQRSQELRFNFEGERVRAFLGGNYFHESGHQRIPLQFDERLSAATLTGMIPAAGPSDQPAPESVFDNNAFVAALLQGIAGGVSGGNLLLTDAQALGIAENLDPSYQEQGINGTRARSYDLFGDVRFALGERWELTAGLRYTWERKESSFSSSTLTGRSMISSLLYASGVAAQGDVQTAQQIVGLLQSPDVQSIPDSVLPNFGTSFQPTEGNGDTVAESRHMQGGSGRLALRYSIDRNSSVYASYGQGRRPPVLVAASPTVSYGAPRFTDVPAEKLDSYELGYKSWVLGGRLRYDAAAYTYDYHNFQTVEQQGTQFVTSNAGEASAYGLEQQLEWQMAASLRVVAGYAYNHARFDTGLYDGNHFRLAPDHTLSLRAGWRQDFTAGQLWWVPSYSWHSRIYFDDNNDRPELQQGYLRPDTRQDEVQGAYGIASLRSIWAPRGAAWRLEAAIQNITNERYLVDAGNTGDGLGYPSFVAGPPRMLSLALRYDFAAGASKQA